MSACMVGEDEATDATPGASVMTIERGLTGCRGQADNTVPSDGRYVLTTFGGPGDEQPMSCGGYAAGRTWYAASRQRYGCGARLKVEANGKCAVVEAVDYGPDVCVERAAGRAIMDVSPLLARHLFGAPAVGWSQRKVVQVTQVARSTPLGPCGSSSPPSTSSSCASATLGREVEAGTCVQSAADGDWYQCNGGSWVPRASSAGCSSAFGHCTSATLGRDVPARSCVQAASNGVWYQCNGQSWVSPVNTASRTGALGACSGWFPL
jgi:hypothetical protein